MKSRLAKLYWVIGVPAGILLGIVIFLALFIRSGIGGTDHEPMPFEREQWLHGTNENKMYFPRLAMGDDLLEKKTLYGMSEKQVRVMLGKPTESDIRWGEGRRFRLLYWLGPERGMSVDSEWLGIVFDRNGKVSKYELVRD